jgi:hypothetical protein
MVGNVFVHINHGIKGLVTFADTAGETLSKNSLRAIIYLFQSK